MTLPLWILAIPSLVLGAWLHLGGRFTEFLAAGAPVPAETMNPGLMGFTSLVGIAGIALAWNLYRQPHPEGDPILRLPGYTLLANLWYIDSFWNVVGARGVLAVGRAIAWLDRNIVDGAVNQVGILCARCGQGMRRTTSGQAQSYAAVFIAALVLIALTLALFQRGSAVVAGDAHSTSHASRTTSLPVVEAHR